MTAVRVSNADRVVFPASGYTKGDVVAYYRRAAPAMLPHVIGRPITIKRYPKGLAGKGFMQKNVATHFPAWIERIELPRKGGTTVHPAVDSADGLAYLANQGAIEVHTPTSRKPTLYEPDRIIIDLDPEEGEVDLVRRAALAVKAMLDDYGVPSVPMCTGSKGYHVVVCIEPLDGRRVSRAVRELSQRLIAEHPDSLTTAFRKDKRGGRVFVDTMRNRVPSTVIAPWSLRARPSASIAVPLTWHELEHVAPDGFDLSNIDARLAEGDALASQTPIDLRATDLGATSAGQ